ncbi:uncharacterized protein PITG_16295 [Phytophthora infestans T30-4]|uniref:Uncharacterized protein n=1 Tax=Phytophthora infestans (strain T30-4) TaxID=403677 RepID=D0NTY2_PHYIT|nr:uncharacterized protein PITG_16295 [Phytophthora infestans T30-4]EEY65106.1 hypothetical protein PITG_16295 [Phytophthora infestans T30-4]|eukprot:XP_002897363.1 hypothetical protein PITG_16295 [Phytophthora infestans T30-4]
MVDENLECSDRLELISRAGVVQLVSQLHRPNFQNHLLSNISLAVDSNRLIEHISVSKIRIEIASIIRIGLAYKFVPKSYIYLKSTCLARKNVLELISGDKCFSRISIESLYCLATSLCYYPI